MPGNMVLTDMGFGIADDLALYDASLSIPSFTKGKVNYPRRRLRSQNN